MRREANEEVLNIITKSKEEIIDGLDQAEARLQEQIAEGNKQTMAALQRLRKHCLPPLLATVKQHGQSPPPRRQRPSAARAPPQGAPGGSGQLGAPRARPQPLKGAATPPRPLELAACKGAGAAAFACR